MLKIVEGFSKVKENIFCRSVRDGMVMAFPILIVGSFAVMLNNLPFSLYQNFIKTFCSGAIFTFLNFIQNSTFGMLSIYITLTISIAVIKNLKITKYKIGAIISSLSAFFIFEGVLQKNYDFSFLGAKSMFCAVISGFFVSRLFLFFATHIKEILKKQFGGADSIFFRSSKLYYSFFRNSSLLRCF